MREIKYGLYPTVLYIWCADEFLEIKTQSVLVDPLSAIKIICYNFLCKIESFLVLLKYKNILRIHFTIKLKNNETNILIMLFIFGIGITSKIQSQSFIVHNRDPKWCPLYY